MSEPLYLSNLKKTKTKLSSVTVGFKSNATREEVITLINQGNKIFLKENNNSIKARVLFDSKNDALYMKGKFRYFKYTEDFPLYLNTSNLKTYFSSPIMIIMKIINMVIYKEYLINLHSLHDFEQTEQVSLNEIVIKSNASNDPTPNVLMDTWIPHEHFSFIKEQNREVKFVFKRKLNYIPDDLNYKSTSFVTASRTIDSFHDIKVRKKRYIPEFFSKLIEKAILKNG